MDGERCETCRYWGDPDDTGAAPCRRYPPVIDVEYVLLRALRLFREADRRGEFDAPAAPLEGVEHTPGLRDVGRFPSIDSGDWCGEYRPRPA